MQSPRINQPATCPGRDIITPEMLAAMPMETLIIVDAYDYTWAQASKLVSLDTPEGRFIRNTHNLHMTMYDELQKAVQLGQYMAVQQLLTMIDLNHDQTNLLIEACINQPCPRTLIVIILSRVPIGHRAMSAINLKNDITIKAAVRARVAEEDARLLRYDLNALRQN